MLRKLLAISTGLIVLTACQQDQGEVDIAIRDIAIVDIATGTVETGQTVLIDEGRIVAVQSRRDEPSFAADQTLSGTGAYLMPGLWDMHVHLHVGTPEGLAIIDPARWHVPLSLSYGVTGMRDMASRMDDIVNLRDQLDAKREAGEAAPELVIAGPLFSGPQPWGEPDHAVLPDSVDVARRQVGEHIRRGVDFIKVHDFLSQDIYKAIVDEARQRNYQVVGHLRSDVGPLAATDLGQRDFEHVPPEMLSYCRADGSARARSFYDNWFRSGPDYFMTAMVGLYDEQGCQALFAELAERDVTITPTLTLRKPVSAQRFALSSDLLPDSYRDLCVQTRDANAALSEAVFDNYDAMIREVITSLSSAGVTILAGTDRQTYACAVPGWDLIEELKALVDAGLTRREALDAATISAARKAGRDYPGQIVNGAAADLIMLSGNPLENLDALKDPVAVITGQTVLDTDALARMRVEARDYAKTME
ncbi:amidohydrolase family protein [Algimonas porphyrae]|uniref:Amidohydrolase n=1 Tax=Algimonas porphyrae TaxID=1128113 RepID=A0ABQ5UXH8_9PROT|nr:amidohydrolase family protein [Algimonas porphyrae]GLQ19557.1 amidohydrolase [Algimonas porphyrae]